MRTLHRHTLETAQERCRDNFKVLNWHGANQHCQIKCLKCGLVSVSFGSPVIRGVFKCPCSRKPPQGITGRPSLTDEQINQRLAKRKVEIVAGTYKGYRHMAQWHCIECDHVYEAMAQWVLREEQSGLCPECHTKGDEDEEFALLDSYNLNQEWDYER